MKAAYRHLRPWDDHAIGTVEDAQAAMAAAAAAPGGERIQAGDEEDLRETSLIAMAMKRQVAYATKLQAKRKPASTKRRRAKNAGQRRSKRGRGEDEEQDEADMSEVDADDERSDGEHSASSGDSDDGQSSEEDEGKNKSGSGEGEGQSSGQGSGGEDEPSDDGLDSDEDHISVWRESLDGAEWHGHCDASDEVARAVWSTFAAEGNGFAHHNPTKPFKMACIQLRGSAISGVRREKGGKKVGEESHRILDPIMHRLSRAQRIYWMSRGFPAADAVSVDYAVLRTRADMVYVRDWDEGGLCYAQWFAWRQKEMQRLLRTGEGPFVEDAQRRLLTLADHIAQKSHRHPHLKYPRYFKDEQTLEKKGVSRSKPRSHGSRATPH